MSAPVFSKLQSKRKSTTTTETKQKEKAHTVLTEENVTQAASEANNITAVVPVACKTTTIKSVLRALFRDHVNGMLHDYKESADGKNDEEKKVMFKHFNSSHPDHNLEDAFFTYLFQPDQKGLLQKVYQECYTENDKPAASQSLYHLAYKHHHHLLPSSPPTPKQQQHQQPNNKRKLGEEEEEKCLAVHVLMENAARELKRIKKESEEEKQSLQQQIAELQKKTHNEDTDQLKKTIEDMQLEKENLMQQIAGIKSSVDTLYTRGNALFCTQQQKKKDDDDDTDHLFNDDDDDVDTSN